MNNKSTIQFNDFCTLENGALKSIDFSRLYSIHQPKRNSLSTRPSLRLVDTRPRDADFSGILQRLFAWPEKNGLAIIRRSDLTLSRQGTPDDIRGVTPLPSSSRVRKQDGEPRLKLHELGTATYSVGASPESLPRKDGIKDLGQIEMEIPPGLPRFVTARTLKKMLSGHGSDILFRKLDQRWEICPDEYRVDLADPTQVFRLGEVQIYS